MSKTTQVTTNFTAGELSPRLFGRTDLKKYVNGASKLENFLSETHGGITRRPGTKYITEAHAPNVANVRLVEFQYSVSQSYVLEFGVTQTGGNNGLNASPNDYGYVRFFRKDASTGEPGVLINTIPDPDVPTVKTGLNFVDTELEDLKFAQSADVLYVFSPTRPIYKLKRLDPDDDNPANWSYTKHETEDGPYAPFNSDEDHVLTPSALGDQTSEVNVSSKKRSDSSNVNLFVATDVGRHIRLEDEVLPAEVTGITRGTEATNPEDSTPATITFTNMDSIFFTSGSNTVGTAADVEGSRVEFYKITKGEGGLNDNVFIAKNFTFTSGGGTFKLYNPTTGYPETFEGASAADFSGHMGYCRLEGQEWAGWGTIKTVTNAYTAVVTVGSAFPSTRPTLNWRLGAWSATTGYASTGTFYQDRLWAGNTTNQPQTLWSSVTGAWGCFSPNDLEEGIVLATNAITVTLASQQVNGIRHLIGDTSGLLIMTSGGEWIGRGSSPTAAITPEDMSFQQQSAYGCHKTVLPQRSHSALLFMQRDGEVCRELTYEFSQDRFIAPNITVLSEHITDGGVTDSAYQVGKHSRLWLVKSDGTMVSATYEKTQEVIAWNKHVFASSDAGVAATVISAATLKDDEEDLLFLAVKRDINGTVKTFIEVMASSVEAGSDANKIICSDASKTTVAGSATTSHSGFSHLANEDVIVLGDGSPYAVTVSGAGVITTPTNVTTVVAGKQYTSTLETMPLIPPTGRKEFRGKHNRPFRVASNVYRSAGGSIGTTETVHPIEYSSTGLRTEIIEANIPGNSERQAIVKITNNSVHPMTILSLITEMDGGDV